MRVPMRFPRMSHRCVHLWVAWLAAVPLLISVMAGATYRLMRVYKVNKADIKWMMDLHTMRILGLRSVYPLFLFSLVAVLTLTAITMTTAWKWAMRTRCGTKPHRTAATTVGATPAAAAAPATVSSNTSRTLTYAAGQEVNTLNQALLEEGASDSTTLLTSVVATDEVRSSVVNVPPRGAPVRKRKRTWREKLCLPASFSWRWLHRLVGTLTFVPLFLTAFTGAVWVVCVDWLELERKEYAWMKLMYLHEGRYLEETGAWYCGIMGVLTMALTVAGIIMLIQKAIRTRKISKRKKKQALASPTPSPVPSPSPSASPNIDTHSHTHSSTAYVRHHTSYDVGRQRGMQEPESDADYSAMPADPIIR